MKSKQKQAFKNEMKLAIENYWQQNYLKAFKHLENAHILGQRSIRAHTYSHWWMLRVGLKRNDFREIFGQIMRIIASIIFSRIWVPVGNTGGANVSPVKPMPIPNELAVLMDDFEGER